ncbi:MAG: efflux RND transporter periplasmic adaptor subunit [Kiritimatiellae bacterium]|nr:efflux RND transporter periplasmic adaptor subunit [Kiritimatiellia bacterium]
MSFTKCAIFSVIALVLAGCEKEIFPAKQEVKRYRYAPVEYSDVIRTVEATGTITPRNSPNGVPVGAQVNGKIIKLFVDYNSVVTNGQVVALIDPQVYEANYKNAMAQLKSAKARLVLAEKTFARKKLLREKGLCSEADLDEALANRDTAAASVDQCTASSDQAKANLDYCTIRSPVNGVVLDRKVEEGETVVSSMNAVPVLTIAEDLRTIWVQATVPEADVGNIKVGQTVTFTADAYRKKFVGKVKQIRLAATTTSNVVTYPIIIEAENPGELLFPGMTATLSIETARAEDVPVVSAAAFRFRPKEEDRALVEVPRGIKMWFEGQDGKLTPQVIETGVSDGTFTELLNGADFIGRKAVIGYETKASVKVAQDQTTNPFMPKRPKRGTKGTAPEPKAK